jgi:RyR domain
MTARGLPPRREVVNSSGDLPAPIDTSGVLLSDDLQDLTEVLARHVHDVWAQQRIQDGWQYGPERNDERKEHPRLVPYDQLPDDEKVYDRNTALETLKVIVQLGYCITKPTATPSNPARGSGSMEGDEGGDGDHRTRSTR